MEICVHARCVHAAGCRVDIADLYSGISPQTSSNISITIGRAIFEADWNTSHVRTPSHPSPMTTSTIKGTACVFHGVVDTSNNLTFGPNADPFNVGHADDADS